MRPADPDPIATLVQRTSGIVGSAFLRALVREYAEVSGARLVYVADHRGDHARVLAEWRDGVPGAGGEFVLPGRAPMGPASVSVILRDPEGGVIGHVGVEGGVDIPWTRDVALFTLLTERTAGEVQRHRHVAALRSREEQLAAARARLVHAIDEERRRIGRDIHDGVQQRAVAATHLLTLAERRLQDAPDVAADLMRRAREEVKEATRELRDLSRGLHPVGLADGLGTALEILAARSPVPLHIDALPDRRLPEPVEVTIFFLVSEAVTNAGKHAGASWLRVEVAHQPDTIVATVADDGAGGADPARGTGLRGLQDRIATLGGTLEVDSPPGGGTCSWPASRWRRGARPGRPISSTAPPTTVGRAWRRSPRSSRADAAARSRWPASGSWRAACRASARACPCATTRARSSGRSSCAGSPSSRWARSTPRRWRPSVSPTPWRRSRPGPGGAGATTVTRSRSCSATRRGS
ncbi:hypothetical protein FSW04_18245 [Baekduia soli]|uniref:histidine kinase n=1 Tax=Baekduia soli TaxID=496014 RepID=A0A5B8U888_9ACTN|nr:histidine kinase [Baekduia soli]QEC49326.1 hypothetical protein FSW04_18245 [Baekduia soli]